LIKLDPTANKILFYPDRFPNPKQDETLSLHLEAVTMGRVEARLSLTIKLISAEIEDAYLIQEPQFLFEPQPF
jgi:hypothetical protein